MFFLNVFELIWMPSLACSLCLENIRFCFECLLVTSSGNTSIHVRHVAEGNEFWTQNSEHFWKTLWVRMWRSLKLDCVTHKSLQDEDRISCQMSRNVFKKKFHHKQEITYFHVNKPKQFCALLRVQPRDLHTHGTRRIRVWCGTRLDGRVLVRTGRHPCTGE